MRLEVAPAEVPVQPGVPAAVIAQVFNTDEVINAYKVRVFGVDPEWIRLDEERLSLFPGSVGTITVLVDVPATYPAGELRLGIEVTPLVDPSLRQVGESILVVPANRRASLSLDPTTLAGGKRAQFNLTVTNEGNAPLALTLGCTDPEDKVRVTFSPPVVELEPKQRVIVPAKAVGKRPIMGNPAPRSLSFTASGADNSIETFATFLQRPLLGRGLVSLVGLLLGASIFALTLTSTLGRVVDESKVDGKLLERAVNGDAGDRGAVANPGTAAGQVTLLTSGAGVSGVTIELFGSDNPATPVASAASGADGTYAMTGLGEGIYKLRFRGAGFGEIWYGGALAFEDAKDVTIALGRTTGGLDIALGGIPGSITGVVVGTDPADAVVTLQLPAEALGSATDAEVARAVAGADGSFTMTKIPAPASYILLVTKDGFATERRVLNLAAAEEKVGVEIILRQGDGLIAGRVTSGGVPLGGVDVVAASTTSQASTITLTSDPVGTYTLRNLPTPGTYTVSFVKAGYAAESLTVALEEGEQRTGTEVSLARGTGSIAGTVVRQGTGPVGGVTVTVHVDDTPVTTETLSVGDVGTYLLTGLPVPGTYTLTFSGRGLASQVRSVDLDPKLNANLTGVDATMTSATAEVIGTVSDEKGPAAEVTVVLSDGTETWTTRSASDPAGSYVVRDVKPGTYTLTFSRVGAVPKSVLVSLSAGDRKTINVSLEPRASISGTVSRKTGDATSVPLAGGFVVAYRVADFPATVAAQAITDASGNYVLANLAAPEVYIIEFRPPDGAVAKASQQLTLQAGEQRTGLNVTIDLGS